MCDNTERCTGTSMTCPADTFSNTATVCRAPAGSCDASELCTGSSTVCPANTFLFGVTCRHATGICDVPESCTGTNATCPADSVTSSMVICRSSAGECDVDETCTGSSGTCPADSNNAGLSCTDDGDACTPDTCNITGVCEHLDSDADASGELCDNCADTYNPDQENSDCIDPAFPRSQCSTAPAELAGCCDGGDLCDLCPAQNDNQNCDADASGAEVIGSGGGTVATPDGSTTVSIPPGALPSETSVSVTENAPASRFTLSGGVVASVSGRPSDQQFALPVTMTLQWKDRDADNNVDLGSCDGGADDLGSCDSNADCASGDCSATVVVAENDLVLRRNNDRFSHAGFEIAPFECADHLSGACASVAADCADASGTGQASVARCCDPATNQWSFQTCSFSEYSLGDPAAGMIPGKGKGETDCAAEWVVDNPLNVPAADGRGYPSTKQRCTDGDASCDLDASANGTCAFEVGVCMNVEDSRLIDRKTGAVACTPGSIATWAAVKPRPDSDVASESQNATGLRDAVAALGAATVSGKHQEIVTFSPVLDASTVCTDMVPIAVPLADDETSGKATLKVRSADAAGVVDSDLLKLRCDPAP